MINKIDESKYYIRCYDNEGEPTCIIKLSEEGYKKYKLYGKWDSSEIELVMNLRGINECT